MPTFSFPVTTGVTTIAAANKQESAANAKGAKGKKKTTVTENATANNTQIVVEADHANDANDANDGSDTSNTVIDNDDYAYQEPTFPDVVILKQTDKNYIVKHNTYSIPVLESTNENNQSLSREIVSTKNNNITRTTFIAQHSTHSSDLVSPNQIYKGQINKKRGRKPKAGFILNSSTGMYDTSEVPNIILHLKCRLSDLKTNESISNFDYTPSISEVESYNLSTNMLKSSDIIQSYNSDTVDHNDEHNMEINITTEETSNKNISLSHTTTNAHTHAHAMPITNKKNATEANIHIINERHQKEIMKKINRLKYSFHNGETIQMKLNHKSACFWDTCEFDGPIFYIPIMIVNGVFHVSGCYCSPECALASLLKEQMDTSTKFERMHLLHLLYGNSNSSGFKPAPNPNYLLDKYYGNLTIDEYRSLLKGTQMIHVVNKPLTHILPELYEDNNDFLVNNKVIPTNTLKLKKRYKTTLVQNSSVTD